MKTDRIIGFIFMLFSAAMFAAAFDIRDLDSASGLSSRFWPMCVLGLMFTLSACLTFSGGSSYSLPWLKIAACLAFFLGYVIALMYFGYVISTLVFQTAFLYFLGIRGIRPVVFAVCSTAVITILFRVVLNVLLPNGVGIFREFSIMLLG